MSLARAWRRQLYGASSAALVVPSAMLAALVVLALGGGFSQVGVLGQIFAGPPAPPAGGLSGGGGGGAARPAGATLPLIPVTASPRAGPPASRGIAAGGHASPRSEPSTPAGGAIAPTGAAAPIVSAGLGGGGGGPSPRPVVPSRPAPAQPSPQSSPPVQPSPPPQPTVVDQVVKLVTPVTEQAPAPVGPVATGAVQSAGGAADSLLPPSSGSSGPR